MKEDLKDFNWKKVESDLWNHETMPLLAGRIKQVLLNAHGKNDYVVESFDGVTYRVLGTVLLCQYLDGVSAGDAVCIEFKGSKDVGKGHPLKLFEVSIGEKRR